jgi:hypothetical protein
VDPHLKRCIQVLETSKWLPFQNGRHSKMATISIANQRLISIHNIIIYLEIKGLGAIRAKIGPTSDVEKMFSKVYSQYVFFRNKYS